MHLLLCSNFTKQMEVQQNFLPSWKKNKKTHLNIVIIPHNKFDYRLQEHYGTYGFRYYFF